MLLVLILWKVNNTMQRKTLSVIKLNNNILFSGRYAKIVAVKHSNGNLFLNPHLEVRIEMNGFVYLFPAFG